MNRFYNVIFFSIFSIFAMSKYVLSQDVYDILDIKINSTLEEATAAIKSKLPNSGVIERTGKIKTNNFTSESLIFGIHRELPASERDSRSYKLVNMMRITNDQANPNKVISIDRQTKYFDNFPTYDNVLSQITEKYGKPLCIDRPAPGQSQMSPTRIFWSKNSSIKETCSREFFDENNGFFNLPGFFSFGEYNLSLEPQRKLSKNIESYKNLGEFVYCVIDPYQNGQFVHELKCQLTDSSRVIGSYNYIDQLVKNGNEKSMQNNTERGGKVKLTL